MRVGTSQFPLSCVAPSTFDLGESPHSRVVDPTDASDEDSLSFAIPTFASPWGQGWVLSPLGLLFQLHTPPLPATHMEPAID